MFDSLKKMFLGEGLKALGNAIPFGGPIVGMLSDALGIDSEDPKDIEAAIAKDPEALVKLKQFEATHKETLENIRLEGFKLQVADKARASNREVEMAKITGKRDYFMPMMALIITAGFFGILSSLLAVNLSELDETSKAILNIMIGVLAGEFKNVMGYYFGSSKSSADKTKLGK